MDGEKVDNEASMSLEEERGIADHERWRLSIVEVWCKNESELWALENGSKDRWCPHPKSNRKSVSNLTQGSYRLDYA